MCLYCRQNVYLEGLSDDASLLPAWEVPTGLTKKGPQAHTGSCCLVRRHFSTSEVAKWFTTLIAVVSRQKQEPKLLPFWALFSVPSMSYLAVFSMECTTIPSMDTK